MGLPPAPADGGRRRRVRAAGRAVQIAIVVLAVGHVVSYAVLYGLCLRAVDAADLRRQPSP